MTLPSRAVEAVRNWLRATTRWTRPAYGAFEAPPSEDEWRRQFDESSQTIRRTASTLIASCLFSVLTLGAGDEQLVSAEARIHIPVAGTDVSYTGFLLIGPVVLIGLTFYVHVLLEQVLHLAAFKGRPALPFMFNVGTAGVRLLSGLVFYWMVPAVLAVFTWKALPRAEAPLLMLATSAVTVAMVALRIRRFRAERSVPLTRSAGGLLVGWWLLAAALVALLVLQCVWLAGPLLPRALTEPADPAAPAAVRASPFRERPRWMTRRLSLYNAQLHGKNLGGLNAAGADLRKANLRESDLEGAVLSQADLRKADLAGANLAGVDLRDADLREAVLSLANLARADLRGARLDDYTKIDAKWKSVWCLVNGQLGPSCSGRVDLAWTDLGRADLRAVRLAGMRMVGANLRDTDLRKAVLSRADLRLADLADADLRGADLRGARLPPSVEEAKLEGALRDPEPSLQTEATVILFNRTTESCLTAANPPDNDRLLALSGPSVGCASADPRQLWKVKRLAPGYLMLWSAIPGRAGTSACLDGTASTAAGVKVHTWQCIGPGGHENQHWKITLLEDEWVSLAKRETKFCLDSTGIRDAEAHPHLWNCEESVHNQHWKMIFR